MIAWDLGEAVAHGLPDQSNPWSRALGDVMARTLREAMVRSLADQENPGPRTLQDLVHLVMALVRRDDYENPWSRTL